MVSLSYISIINNNLCESVAETEQGNRAIASSYDYSPKGGKNVSTRYDFACALRLSICAKEGVTAFVFKCVCG